MSTYQDRLLWAMQRANISTQALANALGVSYQAVRKVEGGMNKSFSAANNEKAADVLCVHARWLATGEGPVERPNSLLSHDPERFMPILAWEHPDDLPEGEFIFIPLLNVTMSAGHGAEQDPDAVLSTGKPIAFRADWIREMHLRPGSLKAVLAHGDSMEPRIQDGDALVVDTSQQRIIDGRVYAIYYEGGERVKRMFKSPGGGLLIRSDNPNYPDIHVQPSDVNYVRIIGRVVHITGNGGL